MGTPHGIKGSSGRAALSLRGAVERPIRWIAAAGLLAATVTGAPRPTAPAGAPPRGVVFTVTTTSDAGAGSLRRAILDANANPGADTIAFAIPFSGPQIVRLTSALPAVTDPVTLDGFTQRGSRAETRGQGPGGIEIGRGDAAVLVSIDGTDAGTVDGLVIASATTLVRGLSISGFEGHGIRVDAPGGARLEGNRLAGNGGAGVAIAGGAGTSLAGNVFADNAGGAIDLDGGAPTPNDALDADSGANGLQNVPGLISVARRYDQTAVAGQQWTTEVRGALHARPDTPYTIELFRSDRSRAADPLGAQGDRFLGATTVVTDAQGNAALFVSIPGAAPIPSGEIVTATAADPQGSTSEMSGGTAAPALVIQWASAISGNWNDTTKWMGGVVPGAGDDAQIIVAGTYTVTFNASATVNSLTVGGASGTQTFSMGANSLTLAAASAFGANGVLAQSGGTIQGAGTLTLSGPFNWSGGTLTGAGTINANGAVTVSGAGAKDVTSTRTLNVNGNTTWGGTGTLRIGSGAVVHNTGNWDWQIDPGASNPFGGTSSFVNDGTFRKTTATGTTTMGVVFSNNDTVDVQTGVLNFLGGGTDPGSYFVSSGAELQFGGGTHDLDPGMTFTGPGDLTISSGTVNLNTSVFTPVATTVTLSGGTLNASNSLSVNGPWVHSTGTLSGTAMVTLGGASTWSGGAQTGTGITVVNGTLALSGTLPKDLTSNRELDLNNTTTWTSSGGLRIGSGAAVQNNGTFDAQNDVSISNPFGGSAFFNNPGTFRKSVGTGTTTFTGIVFTNTGAVDVQTGTLALSSSSSSSSSGMNVAGGAVIQFSSTTFDLDQGTTFTGSGSVNLVSGTLSVNGSISGSASTTFNQSSGTLSGLGDLTLGGPTNWTGGTMTAAGTTTVDGALSVSGGSVKDVTSSHTLNVTGPTVWTGTGQIRIGTSGILHNTGIWDCQNDTQMSNPFGGTGTFENAGTFKKTVGTGTSLISVVFTSTGPVQAQTGTLNFGGGGSSTAGFSVSAGATLQFSGGTFNVNAPTTFTGPGDLTVSGGTVNLNTPITTPAGTTVTISGGTLSALAALTIGGPFAQSAGTLSGTALVSVAGASTWSGGTMTGAGTTTLGGAIAINGSSVKDTTSSRIVNLNGNTTWTGTGPIRIGTGSVFNNTATFDAQTDQPIQNPFGGAATFNNTGTFRKSAGAGTTSMTIPFTNAGSVDVQTGTLAVTSTGSSTGGWNAAAATTIQFSSNPFDMNAGTAFTGAGTVLLASGILNVNAAVASSASTNWSQAGGQLAGTGTFTINGPATWSAGSMTAAGTTNFNGTLGLSGTAVTDVVSNRVVNTAGAVSWTGTGFFRIGTGGVLNNSGNWNLQSDSQISDPFGGSSAFNNSGTFRKTAGAGTTVLSVPFTNTGIVEASSGTINITSGSFVQTAGSTSLLGGTISDNTPMLIQGGVLQGSGTITGDVTVSGTGSLGPGLSAGTIAIVGDYVQTAPGTFDVELGGLTPGTQHDRVNISGTGGTAALAGVLDVSLIGGFTPALGNSFTIMSYVSHTGTFGTTNLPALGGGLQWTVTYTATEVILGVVSSTSADLLLTKSDSPDPVLVNGTLTYTVNITNLGADTATGVSMTDTLPNGTSFLSAIGTGWTCNHVAGTVTCTRASLAVGAAPAITITVTAPSTAGPITNTASVDANEPDPTPGNNSDTEGTTVNPAADLSLTKSDSPDPVNANGTLTYTIAVSNAGPSTATSLSVTDTLPGGAAFVSATGSGWTCNNVAGTVTCTRASLAAGAAPNITITVTAPASGPLSNTASVTAAETDPTPGNNSDTEATVVTPIADLSLTKSDSPDPVNTGATLTYTIAVSNAGPSTASSLSVTDTLPVGTSFVSATGTGWTCNNVAGTVTCTRSSLAPGAAPSITLTVTAPLTAGSISNTASVSSSTTDPTPGNNSDTEGTTVTQTIFSADLSLNKTDSPDPVNAGGTLVYTIAVSNAGPDPATSLTVTDTLPAGVGFVSATGSGWTCNNVAGTITCTRASLAVGSAPNITITVTAPAAGPLSNTASVSAAEPDPAPGNNSDTESTAVTPIADLSLTKSDSPDPVNTGATLTYTIAVSNAGPSTASSLSVTDTIPVGTSFVSAAGTGWTCNFAAGTVTCTRASLAVGAAPNITITVTAPGSAGSINNTASVSAATTDPTPGNNSDTEGTTVNQTVLNADLSLTKSDSPDPVAANGTLTYTIAVSNAGPDPATNVSVTDTLPAGAAFISASGSGWTCNFASGTVTCTRASLAVGAAPNISIFVTPPPSGPISNTASVSAAEADSVPGNNSDTESTAVTPIADLSLTKSDSPDPVNTGATLIYTIAVSNGGPSTATGLTVTDTLPAGTSFVSATGTGWTCNNVAGTVTCTRASLAVGAAPNITITVTAPSTPGTINNTAAVASTSTDPTPGNDADGESTTVNQAVFSVDLSIVKSDALDPVSTGGSITYTLTVANGGPDPATNVTGTDTLPAGVVFVSASGSGWSCSQAAGVVTCTRATLALGTAPIITITVTAPVTAGVVTNTASVAGAEPDPTAGNNQDSEDTTVAPVTGEPHDLALAEIKPPKKMKLSAKKPVVTETVQVFVQNRSPHDEVINDLATLDNLVKLFVNSLGPCANLIPRLDPNQNPLPRTIPPKRELEVNYLVTYDSACVNDPLTGVGHRDWSYTAMVDHSALDGNPDVHTSDDICPYTVTPPFVIDLYPDGTIKDKGCGSKLGNGLKGGPVETDVKFK